MSTAPTSLVQAQSSVLDGVKNVSNLLNLAPGPTAVAGFIAEGIFKAINLGLAIHKARRAADLALDTQIRLMDLVHLGISIDLDDLELQSFYGNSDNFVLFKALSQFDREILEYENTGGNPSPETRRLLVAAMDIVQKLKIDPHLTHHPELANLFAIGLDPTRQSARELVLAYVALFPNEALPCETHYDQLASYWQTQLGIALGDIGKAQAEAQVSLNQSVRKLFNDAIFDSRDGVLPSTLGLLKSVKVASIDSRVKELTVELNSSRDEDEKASIQSEIDNLTAWKTRLG